MLLAWGIVLAGGAGAFAGGLIAGNAADGTKYTPQLLGQALPLTPQLSPLAVFCSGLALGLIFCFGIWLIARAVRRHARRGAQRRAAATPAPARPQLVARATTPTVTARGRAVAIAAKQTLRGIADDNAAAIVALDGARVRSRGTQPRTRGPARRTAPTPTLN